MDSGFLVNRNMDCIRDGWISSIDLSFQSLRKKKTGTLESSSQSRLKTFWKKYLDKVCLFHKISCFFPKLQEDKASDPKRFYSHIWTRSGILENEENHQIIPFPRLGWTKKIRYSKIVSWTLFIKFYCESVKSINAEAGIYSNKLNTKVQYCSAMSRSY